MKFGEFEIIILANFGEFQKKILDFLVTRNMNLLPIEVKKSKNFETSSLDRFIDKYKAKESIILSPKSMKKEDKKVFLPFYMAYLLQ